MISNIIDYIINYYGKNKQVMQCIEEMAELTKELLKDINRGKKNIEEIKKEITDVEFTIAQMKVIYGLTTEEELKIRSEKIDILLSRIAKEGDDKIEEG